MQKALGQLLSSLKESSDPKDPDSHETVSMSDYSHCTTLATETLVSSVTTTSSRQTNSTSCPGGSIVSEENIPSKSKKALGFANCFGALKKCPFEKMNKAQLKFITWKTVFLIAITTFRRCSDIQSLTLGEENVRVQNKGTCITFVRKGLSKQDRVNHTSPHIFIPAFPDSKLLNPKRSLAIYLKRVEQFRQKDNADEPKLFISYIRPHNPVSS